MAPRTFCISVLGCKVNQYEAEQIATLLRGRGLSQVEHPSDADIRIVHSCAVTTQAASKSRQTARRLARTESRTANPPRTVVTGCWATGHAGDASSIQGIDAVLGHHDLADQLNQLLADWTNADQSTSTEAAEQSAEPLPESVADNGWMIKAGTPAVLSIPNEPHERTTVNEKLDTPAGTHSLPLLDSRQTGHQRAFLKIQDGCDAHCTYCIIPKFRPKLWSKPIEHAVEEARRLVSAGHKELVLTGIFLGAYGQHTALRRRHVGRTLLADIVHALCTNLPDLRRLRLSSLEPGDLTDDLIAALRSHPQVVPHFHLPLQSGSPTLLRRMNRQYTREDFLRMIGRLREAFDRPALTTDIIVGFPGETDEEFDRTLEVVDAAGFIHIHAFAFSPRPGTAAARWTKDFVRGPIINERIKRLEQRAAEHSLAFRREFLNETMQIMVERPGADDIEAIAGLQHGRCERYFPIHFEHPKPLTGELVTVRIDQVTPRRTHGTLLQSAIHNPRYAIS